jgi:methylated-DNA-protein-cysteine methyltransferase-like protein
MQPGKNSSIKSEKEEDILFPLWQVIRSIPSGKVISYGQAAGMTEGIALTPRQVGRYLAACPSDVPWHRVVGAKGDILIGKRDPQWAQEQRRRLAGESVIFLSDGRVNMKSCQWNEI